MDPVTTSLVNEFTAAQQIATMDPAVKFEHFVNYVVVFEQVHDTFDVERVATGPGEFGLDGIAIIVNDTIIEDEEQLDDIARNSTVLMAHFVFTQAKMAGNFDSGEISKFMLAVCDFFSDRMALNQNERIQTAHRIKQQLYSNAAKFSRGLPKLSMSYACTGTWKDDRNIVAVVNAHKQTLVSLHMFGDVDFRPLDGSRIQKLYFQTKNSVRASILFPSCVALPPIPGVREAYIGVVEAEQFRKLIVDENGTVMRRLFFDNVRDFQGDTPVNTKMGETLRSTRRIEFPLRNNGVTVVARRLQRIGNEFQVEDFQIVNGCQTSHVLAGAWAPELAKVLVPVKLIATDDEEVTRLIIIASNSQNKVDEDTFWALDQIHKEIEVYFSNQPGDQRLFYERRPGQFNAELGVEKVRIVTKEGLLKVYASVYLEEPNQVGRYYKDLLPRIRTDIFVAGHSISPYYTAAFMAYRLEWLLRNRRLDPAFKPFRYAICMAVRLLIERERGLEPTKKLSQKSCDAINSEMFDMETAVRRFEDAISVIREASDGLGLALDRRTAKMKDLRDRVRTTIAGRPASLAARPN